MMKGTATVSLTKGIYWWSDDEESLSEGTSASLKGMAYHSKKDAEDANDVP